jgi:4-azaleucine resistance transporter AzlC
LTEVSGQQNQLNKVQMFQKGVKVGLPITIGYVPVAITFGVLATQSGLSLLELTLMSAFVFAGASQFMGVNMIVAGISAIEIIIATFVLNFRHFIMSLSLMNEFRHTMTLGRRFGLTLLLTDESFAVSSIHKHEKDGSHGALFFVGLYLSGYLSWVFATFLGGLLGEVIPEQLSQSMGIAIYALFIGLLVPSVKKDIKLGLIAVLAMLINVLASQFVSSGWALVSGIIIGGFSGVFLFKEKRP